MHEHRTILEPDALRYDAPTSMVTLVGSQCRRCSRHFYPPRRRCAACARESLDATALSRDGVIGSYTQLQRTPREAWVDAPYIMAEVQLPEGLVIYAHIVGCEWQDLRIGMPVQLVPLPVDGPDGEAVLAYAFTPIPDEGQDA